MERESPFLQRLRRATAHALSQMRAGKSPAAANAEAGRLYDVHVRDVAQETGRYANRAKREKQARSQRAALQTRLPL